MARSQSPRRRGAARTNRSANGGNPALTPTETTVKKLLDQGHDVKHVAEKLGSKTNSVYNHIRKMRAKGVEVSTNSGRADQQATDRPIGAALERVAAARQSRVETTATANPTVVTLPPLDSTTAEWDDALSEIRTALEREQAEAKRVQAELEAATTQIAEIEQTCQGLTEEAELISERRRRLESALASLG